nr:ribonuclease H-like domain-containing protein [Tanacetum cinerariifolium]
MKMEHYLCHTDYPIWQVIQNGNGHVSVTTDTNGMIKVLPPKTAEEVVAREWERKARTTLLMALPEDHLAKFHKMADAKKMWVVIKSRFGVIKSRFGGNDDSKARDTGRRPVYQDDSKALVTIDGEDIDWSEHVKEDVKNYAMMAYSNLGSDNEVQSCSQACANSYARLKKLYDEQRDKLSNASVEITAYTLALKKTSVDESDAKTSENATCESDPNVETTTSMPAIVEDARKVVSKPKLWTDASIIEDYESDSDDDSVENVKDTSTPTHFPKVEKHGRNSHTRKGLGYAFTRKSYFVCGSFSHLIRDCDFHKKRIAKHAKLVTTRTKALKDKGIVDRRCSRHMTGNKAHLADYQDFKGGSIAFGGSNGRITGKGKIKAGMLDFEDVYYVEELKHYNLFSVS